MVLPASGIKQQSNTNIVISNSIIESRYKLNTIESKIWLYCVSLLDKDDTQLSVFRVYKKDILVDIGHKTLTNYDTIRRSLDGLQSKKILIKEEDRVQSSRFISDYIWYESKGYFDVFLSPLLSPYLLQLREKYSLYSFLNISHLRNSFSIRIYQLLKSFEKIGKRSFPVEDIRYKLKIEDKYPNWHDLKKRVIIPSQAEMKKRSDIYFTFTEQKKGKKVISIDFKIKENPVIKQKIKERLKSFSNGRKISIDSIRIENELYYLLLSDLKMVPRLITKIISTHDYDYVKYVVDRVKRDSNIKNVGSYVKSALDESWWTNDYKVSLSQKKTKTLQRINKESLRKNKDRVLVVHKEWLKMQESKDTEVLEMISNRKDYDSFVEDNIGGVLTQRHLSNVDEEGTLGYIIYKSYLLTKYYGEKYVSFQIYFFEKYGKRVQQDYDDDKWMVVEQHNTPTLF